MAERNIAAEVLKGLCEIREHRAGKRTLRITRVEAKPLPRLRYAIAQRLPDRVRRADRFTRPQAEADVFRRFLAMSGERTTIVVSHRLGSVRLCDRILVLKEGRLLENGTHGELLSQEGEYARLWALQAQWYGEEEGARKA